MLYLKKNAQQFNGIRIIRIHLRPFPVPLAFLSPALLSTFSRSAASLPILDSPRNDNHEFNDPKLQ